MTVTATKTPSPSSPPLHYGLNFPKSCGSIFSRYSLSLSASSDGIGRGLVGLDAALVEQLVAGEDRRPHAEGQRDAVRGPGVHLEDVIVPPDQQLGEVGVLLDRADDHPPEVAAQPDENLLEQIVGQRALRLHSLQLHGDGARLRRPDPDGQHPAPSFSRRMTTGVLVVRSRPRWATVTSIIDESYRRSRLARLAACPSYVPASQLARYSTCSGVRVSIAMPMLCSLSRAIS